MTEAREAFARTRLEVDDDGQEWAMVPVAAGDSVPALLRAVADEWERSNEALSSDTL